MPVSALSRALVPRLCVCCRAPGTAGALCAGCAAGLERQIGHPAALRAPVPAGLDGVRSAAPHAGVARELLAALKFGRLTWVAGEIAVRLAAALPDLSARAVVPVPPARLRLLARGFDPAGEIAAALCRETGWSGPDHRLRRLDRGRQARGDRRRRLASPPRIESRGPAAERVLLVDDVLTTGATLSACARALRAAGAGEVIGATFTREL